MQKIRGGRRAETVSYCILLQNVKDMFGNLLMDYHSRLKFYTLEISFPQWILDVKNRFLIPHAHNVKKNLQKPN